MTKQSYIIWFGIICFFTLMICTPYIIYNSVKFYKNRESPVIRKRRPPLILCFIIIVLIDLNIFQTYQVLYTMIIFDKELKNNLIIINNDIFGIIDLIFVWTINLEANILFVRMWLFYYDWQLSLYYFHIEWTKPAQIKLNNWFAKYHGKLNNYKYLIGIVIIKWIIIVTIALVLQIILFEEYTYPYLILSYADHLLLGLLFVGLFFKSRKFYDGSVYVYYIL